MFDWDEGKNQQNIAKHGVSFAYASRIFQGWVWTLEDERFDYRERRYVSIGVVDTVVVLAMVHTPRGAATRIISARRANQSERLSYERETLRQRSEF